MEKPPTHVDEIDLARSGMQRGDAFHVISPADTFAAEPPEGDPFSAGNSQRVTWLHFG
jgi:hypothetical protein